MMNDLLLAIAVIALSIFLLKKVEAHIPCSTWADNPELCNSDLVSKDE